MATGRRHGWLCRISPTQAWQLSQAAVTSTTAAVLPLPEQRLSVPGERRQAWHIFPHHHLIAPPTYLYDMKLRHPRWAFLTPRANFAVRYYRRCASTPFCVAGGGGIIMHIICGGPSPGGHPLSTTAAAGVTTTAEGPFPAVFPPRATPPDFGAWRTDDGRWT